MERNIDQLEIMWHIYYELALYPDWKMSTIMYLFRDDYWQKEIDFMTAYILERVKSESLSEDPAYQPEIIASYVRREILDFLYEMDRFTAFLRVLQLNPVYRDDENYAKIISYLKNTYDRKISSEYHIYENFSKGFMLIELFGRTTEFKDLDENFFDRKIMGQNLFDFVRFQLVKQINFGQGIEIRDTFIRSFVYPIFAELWKNEIDEMELYSSKDFETEEIEGKGNPFKKPKTDTDNDSLESDRKEQKKVLEQMKKQQDQIQSNIKSSMDGKTDLRSYGITQSDQQLFQYYSIQMRTEREEMRDFWIRLIGDMNKEQSVKKYEETKGKLDVQSLIKHYPDFTEAEKKGSYKNLPVFSRYYLETQADTLPSRIEISFVIDNSGSMTESKIEAARKALSVTLLSLDDFNKYLKTNAEKLGQTVEVLSETWFFGSKYYNVKEFESTTRKKEKSGIISSIVRLDATDGSTDDASCLREISKSITPAQETDLKKGKQIKIIFEVTDGASSFPGSTKDAIKDLLSKHVEVYAFQIGETSDMDKNIFNFVWNEGYKEPRGIVIGKEVETLPEELLKAVEKNMRSAFDKNIIYG